MIPFDISGFQNWQIVFGASKTAIQIDSINSAVAQLECASDAILPLDKKYGLGDLWLPVYFPIVMQTTNFYECEDEDTQEQSDEWVNYLLYCGCQLSNTSTVQQSIDQLI